MNVEMLKNRIDTAPMSTTALIDEIGISRATLYRKIKSGDFSVAEAIRIAKALGFTSADVMSIFFDNEVA